MFTVMLLRKFFRNLHKFCTNKLVSFVFKTTYNFTNYITLNTIWFNH